MILTPQNRQQFILIAIFPSVVLGLVNGVYADSLLRTGVRWYWYADIAQFVVVPAAAFLFLFRAGGYRLEDLGFTGRLWGDSPVGYVGLALFTTLVYWVCYEPVKSVARSWFGVTEADSAFVSALPPGGTLRVVAVFYLCLSAALVEEVVYRSLPWLYFTKTYSAPVVPYCVTTTVLFAAIHWENGLPNVIATATLGLAAALLYTKVRNVHPFCWAHFFAGAWSYPWS